MHSILVQHLKRLQPELSVLVDTTTDAFDHHYMVVLLQTFDVENMPVVFLYALCDIADDETAQGLWDLFKAEIEKDELVDLIKKKTVCFSSFTCFSNISAKSFVMVYRLGTPVTEPQFLLPRFTKNSMTTRFRKKL